MTTLISRMNNTGLEPFDILFRNFFDADAFFLPLSDIKPKYPVDIYENTDGLHLDVAIVGLSEKDVTIEVKDGDILTIAYDREKYDANENKTWLCKGISHRSFSFGWKIANKFDLDKIEASANNGLLSIIIPIAPDKKPKLIQINKK